MNGYVGYYQGYRYEVYAETTYGAQQAVEAQIKAKGRKIRKHQHPTVALAEINGVQYVHVAVD